MRRDLLVVLLPGLLLVALLAWLLAAPPTTHAVEEPPDSGARADARDAGAERTDDAPDAARPPPRRSSTSSVATRAPSAEAGVYTGVVLGPDGPVPQASVALIRPEHGPLAYTRSDLSGRFTLRVDPAADAVPLRLRASHGAHGSAALDVTEPGEYTLTLPGGGYVEGRAIDPEGDGVQTFSVAATFEGRGRFGSETQSFDTRDGRFRLGPIAPGQHSLTAAAEGYQPSDAAPVEVRAGETTTGVTLVLAPSGEVFGRVTDAATRAPIEGALVVPAEWGASNLAESVGAMTGPDGGYVLKALPGKRSSVQVSAPGYRSLLGSGLEVAPGKRTQRDYALTPTSAGEAPSNELVGIGAVLSPTPDGVRLAQLVPDGPAAAALAEGDVVVEVDGRRTAQMDVGDVANAIRGEQGSRVTLMVRRGGAGAPERVVLERARVNMPVEQRRRRGPPPHAMPPP